MGMGTASSAAVASTPGTANVFATTGFARITRAWSVVVAEPFSLDHFEAWARTVILDDGKKWHLQPFQQAFFADLFSGFRENWLIVPEGNGKTTMIACLALYHLRFRDEASFAVAASSRDQARIMYRQAKGMIRRSGMGKSDKTGFWMEAFDGYKRIDLRAPMEDWSRGETRGLIEIHAADAGTGDGVIPTLAILDELHRHRSLDLYNVWRGKLWKRDGQLVTISTAGAPGEEFEETRKLIRDNGEVERRGRCSIRVASPEIVLHEHAVPEDADCKDLELVAEANPFSEITKATLKRKLASPTMSDGHWRRFTCNIATRTDVENFIDLADWRKCEADVEIPAGAAVCLGADGSRTWDTTVVAWATALAETVDVGARVFSVRPDAPHHVLHDGGKVDFADVEAFLIDLFDRFNPVETAYDPRFLERSMELVDARLPSASVIPVEPSSKHARDAYQALYTAVVEGRLRHNGDPVLTAHLANTACDRDDRSREIRRLRKIDGKKPIDAVPALALAVWRAGLAEPSVYDSREAVVL
jgi:phage terminase large subunit-like protein